MLERKKSFKITYVLDVSYDREEREITINNVNNEYEARQKFFNMMASFHLPHSTIIKVDLPK